MSTSETSSSVSEPARLAVKSKWMTPAIRENLQVYLPLIGIVALLSIWANSRNSAFLSATDIQQNLVANSAVGILVVGQTLLLVTGQLDLSVGSLVSLGSVVVAKLILAGAPEFLVVLVAIAIGCATGLMWGLLVALLKVPPFILTLGGLAVFSSIALTVANSTPIPLTNGLSWLQGSGFLGIQAPVLIWLAVLLTGGIFLHFTRLGRGFFAVGANEEAAYLSGLSARRIKILAFLINGLLTGLAAVLATGRLGGGDPSAGAGLELVVIAATVLGGTPLNGGRGTVIGSFLGVMVLAVVTSALTFLNVPDSYDQLVSGSILIVAVTVTATAEHRRRHRVLRGAN